MTDLAQALALIFAGVSLGWAANFSFLAAPQAFRDLDKGRADRFVRNAMRGGNPAAAGLAALAGAAALGSGAIGAAATLALAAALFMLAAWTLNPKGDARKPGVRNREKTERVTAAALTAMLMLVLAAGALMAAAGV